MISEFNAFKVLGAAPVKKIGTVKSRDELRDSIAEYIDSIETNLPMPITQVSRLYNKVAKRFDVSIAELLDELHASERVFTFQYNKTGACMILKKGILNAVVNRARMDAKNNPHADSEQAVACLMAEKIQDYLQGMAKTYFDSKKASTD